MTGGTTRRRLEGRGSDEGDMPPEAAPLGGTRGEAVQRLQIGLFGVASMVLLIGLASVIGNQADLIEEGAVPEAAPTTEPTEAASQRDPLADAGIVPDIPSEPTGSATQAASPDNAGPSDTPAPTRLPAPANTGSPADAPR
ncbi:hypothetical protein [Erythrobacter sp.]|jgi:hypothetical protein|uniref:hypothetical protein n=1 Tax=Erythrobacter sp. TaxID=1042 RepID=UPI002ECCF238|nr:hypothetical protein [Erythrobacter sp.]